MVVFLAKRKQGHGAHRVCGVLNCVRVARRYYIRGKLDFQQVLAEFCAVKLMKNQSENAII